MALEDKLLLGLWPHEVEIYYWFSVHLFQWQRSCWAYRHNTEELYPLICAKHPFITSIDRLQMCKSRSNNLWTTYFANKIAVASSHWWIWTRTIESWESCTKSKVDASKLLLVFSYYNSTLKIMMHAIVFSKFISHLDRRNSICTNWDTGIVFRLVHAPHLILSLMSFNLSSSCTYYRQKWQLREEDNCLTKSK